MKYVNLVYYCKIYSQKSIQHTLSTWFGHGGNVSILVLSNIKKSPQNFLS